MSDILLFNPSRALDDNVDAAPGALAYFYEAGTMTPRTVYADPAETIPHATPLVADATGTFPAAYTSGNAVRAIVKTAAGATLYDLDPCVKFSAAGNAAANVSFNPTIALPFTNVQAAVEGAVAAAASGFAAFGLGITGNAPLLADLDATGTGSGQYRFDAGTTGTFPSGVTASTTGLVILDRQSAAEAVQTLRAAGSALTFVRTMAASVWGTWREVVTINTGAAEGDLLYRGASAWTRLAKGTDGQFVGYAGGTVAVVNPPGWTFLSEISTASGTTPADFAIPSTATQIIISFLGTERGTAGDDFFVRLGTAADFEATGYAGRSTVPGNGSANYLTAMGVIAGTAGASYGDVVITHIGGNKWVERHTVTHTITRVAIGGGYKTLSDVLTRVRIAPTSGAWAGGSIVAGYR